MPLNSLHVGREPRIPGSHNSHDGPVRNLERALFRFSSTPLAALPITYCAGVLSGIRLLEAEGGGGEKKRPRCVPEAKTTKHGELRKTVRKCSVRDVFPRAVCKSPLSACFFPVSFANDPANPPSVLNTSCKHDFLPGALSLDPEGAFSVAREKKPQEKRHLNHFPPKVYCTGMTASW
ncbi:hypothetical protein LY78DRAFT_661111 [Colletotrichum sublineola]|nr:hypothetical protein LY78DRAFT_661111 [Colletotrichum sublineola]